MTKLQYLNPKSEERTQCNIFLGNYTINLVDGIELIKNILHQEGTCKIQIMHFFFQVLQMLINF